MAARKHNIRIAVNEVQRNKLFIELCELLQGWNIISVANAAEVSPTTIYYWLDGTVNLPRLDTIVKVAEAIGYELVLSPIERSPKLTIVK